MLTWLWSLIFFSETSGNANFHVPSPFALCESEPAHSHLFPANALKKISRQILRILRPRPELDQTLAGGNPLLPALDAGDTLRLEMLPQKLFIHWSLANQQIDFGIVTPTRGSPALSRGKLRFVPGKGSLKIALFSDK